MHSLGKREGELRSETSPDSNLSDGKKLTNDRIADYKPPVRHLSCWVEWSDDYLIIIVILVCVPGERNAQSERRSSSVLRFLFLELI